MYKNMTWSLNQVFSAAAFSWHPFSCSQLQNNYHLHLLNEDLRTGNMSCNLNILECGKELEKFYFLRWLGQMVSANGKDLNT